MNSINEMQNSVDAIAGRNLPSETAMLVKRELEETNQILRRARDADV